MYLFKSHCKLPTNALPKIRNLKIMISWHISDVWLSDPTFSFLFWETSSVSNVSKVMYFWWVFIVNHSQSFVFMCKWKIFLFDCFTFSSAYLTLFIKNKFSVYLTLLMDEFLRNIATLLIGNWFKVSQNLNEIILQFLHQSCDFIKLSVSFLLR